jgi:hypothetical protein
LLAIVNFRHLKRERYENSRAVGAGSRRRAADIVSTARADPERIRAHPLESRFLMEVCLRRSNWTPSIVPLGDDHDVYLVVDDLGRVLRLV